MFKAKRGKLNGLPSRLSSALSEATSRKCRAARQHLPRPTWALGAPLVRHQVPLSLCALELGRIQTRASSCGLPQGGGGGRSLGSADLEAACPLLKRFSRFWGAAGCWGGVQEWAEASALATSTVGG